jgi:hypothetical protein
MSRVYFVVYSIQNVGVRTMPNAAMDIAFRRMRNAMASTNVVTKATIHGVIAV